MDRQFAHFLECLTHGVVITDVNEKIVYSNQFLERMFGYEHGQLVGRSIETLLPDVFPRLHELERHQNPKTLDVRSAGKGADPTGCRKDGSVFPVEIGLSPIEIRDVGCIVVLVTDIT